MADWERRLRAAIGEGDQAAALAVVDEAVEEHGRVRERLDMLSIASFEGIMVHVDGVVIDANQRLCDLLGYDRDEILGPQTLRRCVAPEDLGGVVERMAAKYEGAYVISAVRKDGSRFRAELQSKQGHIGARPVRVVAVRDVTERERVNTLLRESEQRFRDLVHVAFDFTVFSRDGVVVGIDGDCESILGLPPEQMVGRSILDFTAPAAQPVVRGNITSGYVGSYEASALHAQTGQVVPVLCVVALTTLDGQPVRAAGLRDLRPVRRLEAERRALEQRLDRAQRLDSLGVLAGGIAHDFNNLLVGILGNAELLRDMVSGDEQREVLDGVVTAAHGASALTRQLLAYAGHRDLGHRKPIDIAGLVAELRVLLGATMSKKARLEQKLEPGCSVLGDRVTLGQVLMNLLTNASEALGDRAGAITVSARRVSRPDARWDGAVGASVGPGDWVLIEVEDTGAGMDEATRGRVFEPFFSTKERGHGLGLAAVLGIVSAHGGAVLVESEPGRGSRFSVLLPAAEAAPAEPAEHPAAPASAPDRCTILIVDDERLVRAQLRRSLERRGYTVLEAGDGRAGLETAERASPDLVILDMTMPDMDGAEVLRRLRASGSRVPVIVSSGYLDVSVQRRLPGGEFQAFLPKPYGSSDLSEALSRALAPSVIRPAAG